MRLLIVRHAVAEEREMFASSGKPDSERPLTERGRAKMVRAAQGLRRALSKIDVLATSPYVRARDTAAILAAAYSLRTVHRVDALEPDGSSDAVADWLRQQIDDSTVAIVGHEPSLGMHASWLLASGDRAFMPLKKGGACLLAFEGPPGRGSATLEWALPPRVLRRLAE